MTNKHIELPALSDEQIKQVLTNSDLWDMHQHMGWYSAPEKNFKTYGVMLARDLIAARDAQWTSAIAAHEQSRVVGEPVARPRELFEAWFTRDGDYEPEWLDRSGASQNLYLSHETENLWQAFQAGLDAPPAPQEAQAGLSEAAKDTIGRWLEADMHMAIMNGANSVSMPDELVEIAGWLFEAAAAPVAQPATEQAEAPCKGTNCRATPTDQTHSPECHAEHDTACKFDPLDTAGNRHPEYRYAGYKGNPLKAGCTADQAAAYREGARATQPTANTEQAAQLDDAFECALAALHTRPAPPAVRHIIEVLRKRVDAALESPERVMGGAVAWYEYHPDHDAWFLAYTQNPKAKTRPLVFGDAVVATPPTAPAQDAQGWESIRDVVMMAGAILDQPPGTADNRHPQWPEAVKQAERALAALAALRASSPADRPVPKFDHAALYRAMHLASMLAGSVGMSNVAESRGHSNDLRAHLSQFIVTKEST